MTNFLISVFGFLFADRILYRLEIFKYISSSNRKHFLVLVLLAQIFFSLFKDLIVVNITLFGIFLTFLIFFYIFHEKRLQNLFETRHKTLIDELILRIQTGSSPLKAFDDIYNLMPNYERKVFLPLKTINQLDFEASLAHFSPVGQKYFVELNEILRQKARVIDQLETFRNSLLIQVKLRRKSRTVSASARAQAVVAGLVYLIFLMISWSQFNLRNYPNVLCISVSLFILGVFLIFKMGSKVKWSI